MSDELTKITVKIQKELHAGFNRQIDRLHIKRDAFLNHMIRTEIPHLRADLEGKRQSNAARHYIAGSLKRLGTDKVNLQVEKATAEMLNEAVSNANMVRDAFINRLILFLRSREWLLEILELPKLAAYSEFGGWVEPMPTSPLSAMEAVYADPMFYLRVAAEERYETGLHLLNLPMKFVGFCCYLTDDQVPGTKAYEESLHELDQLLAELGDSEPAVDRPSNATR